jgi:hypothetical protein
LHIDIESSLIDIPPTASVPVRIARATEIALTDGQPDGRYRFEDGRWHSVKDGVLALSIDRIQPRITNDAPEIRLHGKIRLSGEQP